MDKKAKYQDQIDEISKQIVKEPDNAELYRKRADLFFEKEQIKNALSDYNKILEINPKDVDALLLRGSLFIVTDSFDNAIVWFNRVLKIDSNNNEAKEELGKIYYQKKEYDKALKYFKDIDWELGKEIVEKIEEISNYYLSKGEYDKARNACEGYKDVLDQRWWDLGYPLYEHLNFISDAQIKVKDIEIEDIKKQRKLAIERTKNRENEISKIKSNIFQAISHSISNFVWADKSIIRKIKSGLNSDNDIRRLELLNDLMIAIMNSIKIAFSSGTVIHSRLEKDIERGKSKNNISIYHLLYFCLNINLEQLIEGVKGWGTIREIFFSIDEDNEDEKEELIDYLEIIQNSPKFIIPELSESKITNFIKYFYDDELKTINQFFNIQIDQLQNIYVIKESYSFSILFIVFLELTKNMLKYGTIDKLNERYFKIYYKSNNEYTHIIFENLSYKKSFSAGDSTLQGLEMVKQFAKVLGKVNLEQTQMNNNFNKFKITISIRRV